MSQTVPNTLVIDGTSGNDVLGLRYKGTQLVVILNNVQQRFVSSTINRIEIYAGEGHDIADWSAIAINTYINAGAGNDSAVGGSHYFPSASSFSTIGLTYAGFNPVARRLPFWSMTA